MGDCEEKERGGVGTLSELGDGTYTVKLNGKIVARVIVRNGGNGAFKAAREVWDVVNAAAAGVMTHGPFPADPDGLSLDWVRDGDYDTAWDTTLPAFPFGGNVANVKFSRWVHHATRVHHQV